MAETTQYSCDVCGAVKGATNHWWKIGEWLSHHSVCKVQLVRFDYDGLFDPDVTLHLCGQACVVKRLNLFMEAAAKQ